MALPVASMTGTGTARRDHPAGRLEVEVRSVNHRFLRTTVRTFGPLPPLEGTVEARVRERVRRGHVSVLLRLQRAPAGGEAPVLSPDAFAAAASELRDLARSAGLEPPRVGDVLRVPGVLGEAGGGVEPAALEALVGEALGEALDGLLATRRAEGGRLGEELATLLEEAGDLLERTRARAAEVPDLARRRLEERVAELLGPTGVEPDPAQIVREAALLAERGDVREEIARLEAHLAQAGQTLAEGGPVGRRLDVLVQEMHREANTIGSKAADLDLARLAMDLKLAVERLREQVQNLE